jgi:phosphoribosylformimino-5-aminoimidazole carboxamide ribotide isomerase
VELFPAIDIRQGQVVRLAQGEAARTTVYADDPAAVAERFADEGAQWLHVVDLDRAFGFGDNAAAVADIMDRVGDRVRVQLGGGFRSLAFIEQGLKLGAARVVLGTAAARDPDLVQLAVTGVGPDRVVIGLDARDGYIAVRGWTESTSDRVETLAARVLAAGITTLVYTDIGRDGMLSGPDLAGGRALQRLGARVIISGGIASLDDLRAVRDAGLTGAVAGRAIYEGRFTVREALAAV